MDRNTKNPSNTKNLGRGEYITAPVTRVVRPLPRRAQGTQQHHFRGQWPSDIPVSATENNESAGPSRSAHIPTTSFPGTPSSSSQNSHHSPTPEYQQPTTRSQTPFKQLGHSSRAAIPPPKKRIRIEPSHPKIKKTGIKSLSTQGSKDSHSAAQQIPEGETATLNHFDNPSNDKTVGFPRPSHAHHIQRSSPIPPRPKATLATSGRDNKESGIEKLADARGGEARRESGDTEEGILGGCLEMKMERPLNAIFTDHGSRPNFIDVGRSHIPSIEGAAEESSELGIIGQGLEGESDRKLADVRLREHYGILAPHVLRPSTQNPLPLHGFKALLGRKTEFFRVKRLCDGNGHSSLEVVRSNSGQSQGMGFQKGSLWVLKIFKAWQKDVTKEVRESSTTQMKREYAAYTRIAEVSKAGRVGFNFIMMVEAMITLHPHPCLVLPLMSTDLAQVLDKSKENTLRQDARRILAQTIVGLATLHSIGIIHGDIKPANIFLDARGNVKIGDFGLSHVTESISSLSVSECYNTMRIGTPGYIAPEKATGRGYSYPVDYWSVGWILYELVSERKRLMDALLSNKALKDWADNYRALKARKKFFARERLCDDDLDLLCGLLDPNPQTRMGLEEALLHPFFADINGASEFMEMEYKASLRREEVLSGKWDNYPVRVRYTSEPSDDTEYRWINPYGAYVSDASKLI